MNTKQELTTAARIEQLRGKEALLAWWEAQPEAKQIEHHGYIKDLKKRIHLIKNYVLHRADPEANL